MSDTISYEGERVYSVTFDGPEPFDIRAWEELEVSVMHKGVVVADGRGETVRVLYNDATDEHRGSLVTWGPQLGVELELSQRVSLAPHLDFGWPAGWTNPVDGYYGGLTVGLPIMTDDFKSPSQVNRNYRFIDQNGAIVPYARLRVFRIDIEEVEQGTGYEVVLGLAVRSKLVTDLL